MTFLKEFSSAMFLRAQNNENYYKGLWFSGLPVAKYFRCELGIWELPYVMPFGVISDLLKMKLVFSKIEVVIKPIIEKSGIREEILSEKKRWCQL